MSASITNITLETMATELGQALDRPEVPQLNVFQHWLSKYADLDAVDGFLNTTLVCLVDYFTRLDRLQGIVDGEYSPYLRVGQGHLVERNSNARRNIIILGLTTFVDEVRHSLHIGFQVDTLYRIVRVGVIDTPELTHHQLSF